MVRHDRYIHVRKKMSTKIRRRKSPHWRIILPEDQSLVTYCDKLPTTITGRKLSRPGRPMAVLPSPLPLFDTPRPRQALQPAVRNQVREQIPCSGSCGGEFFGRSVPWFSFWSFSRYNVAIPAPSPAPHISDPWIKATALDMFSTRRSV